MFSFLFGIFETVIFFAANGFKLNFTPFTCIMGTAASVLAMTYIMLGFYIMKSESVAYYTLFVMTGGMALPYLWGLLFLNEEFTDADSGEKEILSGRELSKNGFTLTMHEKRTARVIFVKKI